MKFDENYIYSRDGRPIIKSFYSSVSSGKRAYREHHHAECEISTIISGSGTYAVKHKEYDFTEGDVFLFSGDEIHCITDISENFLLLNIQFDPRILWADSDTLTMLQIFYARNSSFENRINRNCPKTREIHNKIIEISNETKQKKNGYQIMTKHILYSILIDIIRHFNYIDKAAEYSHLESTVMPMKRAIDFIDENLDKQITLSDISSVAAMAPTYFSSIFKKMNGLSPWEYITIKRVEMAIDLLKRTNMNKLEIALQCGFSSSSNFYKAFARVTGKKPSDYI